MHAQICTSQYASIIYKSISYDTITCSVSTNSNDILCAGNTLNDHGFIKKFSAKGTPLFSYQYNPIYQSNRIYFADLKFTSIIPANDGSFILAGNVVQDKFLYTAEYVNRLGILMKIDKYGIVTWCKKFESTNGMFNNGFHLAMSNVIELVNGDLVAYLGSNYGKNYPSYGKIVCLSKNGVQKWSTLLSTSNFDGGSVGLTTKRQIVQTKNGSIVVGDFVYKRSLPDVTNNTPDSRIHFVSLNPSSGALNWERSYHYPLSAPEIFPDVVSAHESTNGNLIFNTSAYSSSGPDKKGLRIETNNVGEIKRVTSYFNTGDAYTQLIDVTTHAASDAQTYLFKSDDRAIIANVNDTGKVVWQKGFDNSGGLFPANSFSSLGAGYGIFMSNFKSRETRLLVTDTGGKIDCINVTTALQFESTVLKEESLTTNIFQLDPNTFAQSDFAMSISDAALQKRIECESNITCCNDFVDSTNIPTINICEGTSYRLPDNNIVKSGGTYFVVLKTKLGCDSIRFLKVVVDKKPSSLSLGNDRCSVSNDSIKLNATSGFNTYNWMNTSTEDSSFIVRSPGLYWVEVTNTCGTRRDSIEVYSKCEFDVFMPSAFTPNKDGINDKFGFSLYNKNRFKSLRIYNRYGQQLFETLDVGKHWDGNYRQSPQPMDSYIYFLELEKLNGERITKRAMFTLIR